LQGSLPFHCLAVRSGMGPIEVSPLLLLLAKILFQILLCKFDMLDMFKKMCNIFQPRRRHAWMTH
jgi:hypothetical protein